LQICPNLASACAHLKYLHVSFPRRFARGDLVDAAIVPAAVSAAESLAEGTAADTERTAKYLERYRDVRAKRAAMQVQLQMWTCILQSVLVKTVHRRTAVAI
jgi:hypothetical protein